MVKLRAPHRWRGEVRWMAAVLAGGLIGLGWALCRPAYYRWAVAREDVCSVVVHCDTSEFREAPVTVLAQYDRIALSPLAQALCLYQNRESSRVISLYPIRIEDVSITATTLTLNNVHRGPLAKISVLTGNRSFNALVRDRNVINGKMHVRLD